MGSVLQFADRLEWSELDERYVNPDSLDVFLRSLSYWSYFHDTLPGLIYQCLKPDVLQREAISLIDVGCGGGDLSLLVFARLAQHLAGKIRILAFDPGRANIEAYKKKYSNVNGELELVEATTGTLQSLQTKEKFDVVFASHSLYQMYETLGRGAGPKVVEKIGSLCEKGGINCIILASEESRAYDFKSAAYRVVGEGSRFYLTSEVFESDLKRAGKDFEKHVADTYIDTSLFFSDDLAAKSQMMKWMDYFLRIKSSKIAQDWQEQLVNLIRAYSVPWHALPEVLKEEFSKHPAALQKSEELVSTHVLFHKEVVILYDGD